VMDAKQVLDLWKQSQTAEKVESSYPQQRQSSFRAEGGYGGRAPRPPHGQRCFNCDSLDHIRAVCPEAPRPRGYPNNGGGGGNGNGGGKDGSGSGGVRDTAHSAHQPAQRETRPQRQSPQRQSPQRQREQKENNEQQQTAAAERAQTAAGAAVAAAEHAQAGQRADAETAAAADAMTDVDRPSPKEAQTQYLS